MAMRIIRLCMPLVPAMVSIPMASAAEIDSPEAEINTVFLQRDTGVEAIQLPEDVTQAEKARMQKNLLLYGNRVLSESEVAKINQEAAAKGGLVYGPWFGGVEKYYSASLSQSISAIVWLASIVAPVLSELGIISIGAAEVARKLSEAAGATSLFPAIFESGTEVSVTMKKQYREVSYSDGTFAYYETGFFAQDLTVDGEYYGTPEAIFSGGLFELNFFGRLRDFYEAYGMLIQIGGSCLLFGSAFLPQDWMILKVFLVVIGGTAYILDFSRIPETQKEDKRAIAKAVLRSFLETLAILAVVWVVSLLVQGLD